MKPHVDQSQRPCGQDLVPIYVSGFDDFNLLVAETHSQRPWVTKNGSWTVKNQSTGTSDELRAKCPRWGRPWWTPLWISALFKSACGLLQR